jgi:hypothetical protein
MTHRDLAARDGVTDRVTAEIEPDEQASPWDGIPPELLYCLGNYDTDSAGGCG